MDFQVLSQLDRRSFHKRAGLGSVVLGSLPGLFALAPSWTRNSAKLRQRVVDHSHVTGSGGEAGLCDPDRLMQ